jgi:NAD(P) transhydrogenase subunit alpha
MLKPESNTQRQPGGPSPSRWIMLAAALSLAAFVLLSRMAFAQPTPPTNEPAAVPATPASELPALPPAADVDDHAHERRFTRIDALLASLTIFVLAVFVGFEVIAKVPPTLHTPLMSGSNAVSGITIVGSILATGHGHWFISLLGMIAVVLAMINVVGGFVVTHRMLGMFRRK